MRGVLSYVILAIAATVSAIPITPAAPAAQRLVERMRAEGLNEHEIATRLSRPLTSISSSSSSSPSPDNPSTRHPLTTFTQKPSRLTSLFPLSFHHSSSPSSHDSSEPHDTSGDIAPGSLSSPEMLPHAAAPDTFIDMMKGVLRGEDRTKREFGYEGKEVEIRRPEGMRHWD